MVFKDSELAHKHCIGIGLEIGKAAHNPFNLKNCINIAPEIDQDFYDKAQINLCGEAAKIDIYSTADNISVPDNSHDYIISSHVIEHVSDIIGAFKEWNRILKKNGIVFIIFPKRNALLTDIGRPLSTSKEFIKAHVIKNRGRVDKHKHIWVFSLQSMTDLISYCCVEYDLNWTIVEALETDDKVFNGHCVIYRKR